jgi:hypothetical protein
MVYSFFISSIESLFVVFATYSAREIISCSGRYFTTFETNGLLTDMKPAFAALECQFR